MKLEALAGREQRRQAAAMFALQGDPRRAAQMLEIGQNLDDADKQLLAQLYASQGRFDDAAKLYGELLATNQPTADTVVRAAELQARRGNLAAAGETIKRLQALELEPGQREILLAQFTFQFLDPAEGLALLRHATQVAPQNPASWRALIVACVAGGQAADARAAAENGTRTAGDNPNGGADLVAVRDAAELLSACDEPILRPVTGDFALAPSSDRGRAAAETLRAVIAARAGTLSPEHFGDAVRDVALRNPPWRRSSSTMLTRRRSSVG